MPFKDEIKKEVWEFARDMFRDTARDSIRARVKPRTELRNELLAMYEVMKEHPGGELSVGRILERQKRRLANSLKPDGVNKYLPGDENKMVQLLSELYEALNQTEEEKKRRIDVFTSLGNLPDEEFDVQMAMLEDDRYLQMIKFVWMHLEKGLGWISRKTKAFLAKASNLMPTDKETAQTIGSFNNFLVDSGVFRGGRRWTPNTTNINSQNVRAQRNPGGSGQIKPKSSNWLTYLGVAIISIIIGLVIARFAI